jgi:uncharacterized protein (DUF58 family)
MKRPELLLCLPLGLAGLLLVAAGLPLFALVFLLITGLFCFDFLRRAAQEKEPESRPERAGQAIEADFRLLGVPPGAGADEVRRVYKRLASQFHPDTGAPLDKIQQRASEEAFVKIRAAYDRVIENLGKD